MKLSNLITLKYGKSQKKIESQCGYPIYGTGGIMGYANTYLYNKETILFGRKGSISNVQFIKEPFWCVDTTFYSIINEDIVIPKYLYYKLSTIDFNLYNEGTTIPSLRVDTLNEIGIDIHDKSAQQHIVNIIGSIDDLIEVNNNIFIKFNEIVHSLYNKYSNKTIVKVKLKDLIYKVGNTCKNYEWKNFNIIDLSSMPENNIVINSSNKGELFNTNIKTLTENTLLYGSIRPYFKKCGFTTNINYVAGTVHSFKTYQEKMYWWILSVISSNDFHKHTNTKSQGTKMPIINWESFVAYDVPIISNNLLKEFNDIICPLYNLIIKLINSNNILLELKKQYLNKFFG